MVKKIRTKELCVVAMFVAITVILGYVSGFLRLGNISKISVSFLSVYISGAAFGPIVGGIVGAVADFISYVVNPTGVYLWQLTIVEFLFGFLFGVFFFRKKNDKESYARLNLKILIYSLIQFIVNIFLKTYVLMNVNYVAQDWGVAIIQRLPGCLVAVVLNFIVINLLERYMPKLIALIRK